jgi:hypothetical protein
MDGEDLSRTQTRPRVGEDHLDEDMQFTFGSCILLYNLT